MFNFRWWLCKKLWLAGWVICPEPYCAVVREIWHGSTIVQKYEKQVH